MKVHAQYFKESGKWYADGTGEIPDETPHWRIADAFLAIRPSPGLFSGVWPGVIILTPGAGALEGVPVMVNAVAPISRAERKPDQGRDAPRNLGEAIAAFVYMKNRFTTDDVVNALGSGADLVGGIREIARAQVDRELHRIGFMWHEVHTRAPHARVGVTRFEWRRTR